MMRQMINRAKSKNAKLFIVGLIMAIVLSISSISGIVPIREARASSNLALNQPADSQTQSSSSNSAAQAVDGSTATSWIAASNAYPQWLNVRLNELSTLSSIDITFGSNTTWYYRLEGSNDNAHDHYTVLVDRSVSGVSGQHITETLNSKFRYVRLVITGALSGATASVQELQVNGEVYSQPAGIVPPPVPVSVGDNLVVAQACPLWSNIDLWNSVAGYPERKPLMGYYDEAYDVSTDWQIKMAVEHGITTFMPCWFRQNDNDGKSPVMPAYDQFVNSLANTAQYKDDMTWFIQWIEQPGMGYANSLSDFSNNLVPYWINSYFEKSNYLKIDNKPVFAIFDLTQFVTDVGGQTNATTAIANFRSAAVAAGFSGLIILSNNHQNTLATESVAQAVGVDYIYSYHIPSFMNTRPALFPSNSQILAAHTTTWNDFAANSAVPYMTTASVGWEASPWGNSDFGWTLSPANYGTLIANAKARMDTFAGGSVQRNMILLDNWNEYAEGHYIIPTALAGYEYLDAIQNVFAPGSSDNHPTPDLSQIPQLLNTPTPSSLVNGHSSGTLRNDATIEAGMKYTTGSSSITVSQLGREFVAGNSLTHQLKIYRDSDKSLLGSCSVSMSSGTADGLGYKYCNLNSSVVLSPNTAYLVVSTETHGGDQFYDSDRAVTVNTGSAAGGVYNSGGTWYGPYGSGSSYGSVNLRYSLNADSFVAANSGGTLRNDVDTEAGMQFTTGNSTLIVSELGREFINGNTQTHTMKLYRDSDKSLVGACKVAMSTGQPDELGYKYCSLTSKIGLLPNTTYNLLSTEYNGGDQFYDADRSVTATVGQVVGGRYYSNGTWGAYGTDVSYGSVNFLYTSSFIASKSGGTLRNDSNSEAGMQFTTGATEINVRALGREYISGNKQAHTLKLYRDSDKSLVASCTINMSDGTADGLGYKYCALSSKVALSANTAYNLLSTETNGGDSFYDANRSVTVSTGSGIGGRYNNGGTWGSYGTDVSYGSVNFLY